MRWLLQLARIFRAHESLHFKLGNFKAMNIKRFLEDVLGLKGLEESSEAQRVFLKSF